MGDKFRDYKIPSERELTVGDKGGRWVRKAHLGSMDSARNEIPTTVAYLSPDISRADTSIWCSGYITSDLTVV